MSDDSIKVPMDHRTTLFYKGVAAGNQIEQEHAGTEFPDRDTKVKAFFFYGGAIAAGEHKITSAEDFGYFMEGLVLRVPRDAEADTLRRLTEMTDEFLGEAGGPDDLAIADEGDLIVTISRDDLIAALTFLRSTVQEHGPEDVADFLELTDRQVTRLAERLESVIGAIR